MLRIPVMAAILVLACSVCLAQFTVTDFLYDDFDDGYISFAKWRAFPGPTGSTVSEYGGRMMFFHPSTATGDWFGVSLDSKCELLGDFDIQVDYEMLIWPNGPENPEGGYFGNGVRTALFAAGEGLERPSWEGMSPGDIYFYAPSGTIHPTDHLSGTLRLTRTGEMISAFYLDEGEWVHLGTAPGYDGPTIFAVGSWSHDGAFVQQDVLMSWDNFLVNHGELLCPNDWLLTEIDIKPGSFPNLINLKSRGVVPVALLGSEIVDVHEVDPNTGAFWGYPGWVYAKPGKGKKIEDVNRDGIPDMMFHFRAEDLHSLEGRAGFCIRAVTWDGQLVRGCDSFEILKSAP